MCGVVGVKLDNPSVEDIEKVKRVLLETEIRGKHASGVSWFDGTNVKTIKKPIPISKLLKELDFSDFIFDDKIRMIGHIRYSTSDLEFNQPLGDEDFSIVHNGVITQTSSEKWKDIYGYTCMTKNDSELLYHCLKNKQNYLEKFNGCSASYITLDKYGQIKYGRNSLRPQWLGRLDNGIIISSTKNILIRSGLKDIQMVEPDDNKDLIQRNMCESYKRIQNIFH